jgi:hypothetical protein
MMMTLKEEYEKKRQQMLSDANEVLRYSRFDSDWGLYIGGYNEGDCYRRKVWEEAMLEYVNENIATINKRAHDKIISEIC